MLLKLPEDEVILQLDGSATVPQITSLERLDHGGRKWEGEGEGQGRSNGLDPLVSFTNSITPTIEVPLETAEAERLAGPERGGEGAGHGVSGFLPSQCTVVNPAELVAMETLLSRQLVEGIVSLLAGVPLL